MDFQSLKRRELQALCKKNKIPANLTNAAMADALAALDIVEGIEEFLNPSSVESPEKAVKASPCVPRTGGRTTSRRKPINEDAESAQISTRARRGTRNATTKEGENENIDVGENVASCLRKMGTPRNPKEISVQKMYSRRSTRLLEKKLMEMNLNDEERIEAIDFGGSDKEMEGNVKKQSDDLGGVLEDQESARELEQPSDVLDESDIVLVPEENTVGLTLEMGEDVDDEVNDTNKSQNEVDYEVSSEGYAESDIRCGENMDNSVESKDEAIEKEGSEDSGYVATADCLVFENAEKGFDAENDLSSKYSADIMEPADDVVHGMGEFLNQSFVESPEKTVKASVSVPCTGGRTSTRKAIAEEGENAKIDETETPGLQSHQKKRRDVAFLSSQKKGTPRNQKEDVSVQKMYSGRSTRLSEKKMMELNLDDEEGMEPIDFGGSDKEMANEMKVSGKEDAVDFVGVWDVQGLNQETKSDYSLKTTDLEDLVDVDEKSDNLSENALELEQPSEVLNEPGILLVSEEKTFKFTPDESEDVDGVNDANKAEYLVPEKGERGLNAEEDLGLEDSDDIMDVLEGGVLSQSEFYTLNLSVAIATADQTQDVKLQNQAIIESDLSDVLVDEEDLSQVEFDISNLSVSIATEDEKEDVELQNQAVIDSDVFSAEDPKDEFDLTGLRNEEYSDHLVTESSNKTIGLSSAIDCPLVTDSQMSSCSVICESAFSDQVTPQVIANIDNLMAPSDKTSSAEVPAEMPFSTLAADAEQMSSGLLQPISDRVICPASVTPKKKFSSMIPTPSQKISILMDENKENIDNSGIKLDLTKEKGKKEDPLNEKSKRQLNKMLKEKLQTLSKKNVLEEKDIAKVGRARPALQSLSENCLVATEPEIDI